MDTGKALEIVHGMAKKLVSRHGEIDSAANPGEMQKALDTVEDFIVNNFETDALLGMDKMDLWHVRISWDLIVRAENPSEARIAAGDAVREPMFGDEPDLTMPERVSRLCDLPKHWDGECRPYGERHPYDLTIAEQLR